MTLKMKHLLHISEMTSSKPKNDLPMNPPKKSHHKYAISITNRILMLYFICDGDVCASEYMCVVPLQKATFCPFTDLCVIINLTRIIFHIGELFKQIKKQADQPE